MKNIIVGRMFLLSELKRRIKNTGVITIETDFETMNDIVRLRYFGDDGSYNDTFAVKQEKAPYNSQLAESIAEIFNTSIKNTGKKPIPGLSGLLKVPY